VTCHRDLIGLPCKPRVDHRGDRTRVAGSRKRAIEPTWNRAPRTGALDAKTRELVALAVAVTVRCDGCVTTHVELVRKQGATRDEIADVLGVAVTVNAGAALVYSARTIDAFHAAEAAASDPSAGRP
jgi:AhpD family alkylhydroperoxidase